ncbi:lysophospholipid acyltransferase family protein [Thiolapillus sp.]
MSPLRIVWRLLLLLLHVLAGIWLSLSIHKTRLSDDKILPDPEPVARWSGRLLKIMGIQVITHGDPPREPGLIVSNHISWVDIPTINALTGAAFLSKNSIRYWPVIGWFAIASGTVFIRRGNHEAQRVSSAIAERLREERNLAIFPEGSTSDGRQVRRFFPRLFGAAIDAHSPVIPIALRYSHDGKLDQKIPYTKGRSFFLILFNVLARKNSEVHVVFCEPIPSAGRDRRSLAEASYAAIQAALATLPVS